MREPELGSRQTEVDLGRLPSDPGFVSLATQYEVSPSSSPVTVSQLRTNVPGHCRRVVRPGEHKQVQTDRAQTDEKGDGVTAPTTKDATRRRDTRVGPEQLPYRHST